MSQHLAYKSARGLSRPSQRRRTPIFVEGNPHPVAWVVRRDGDSPFLLRFFDKRRHLLRMPERSICFSFEVLDQAEELGAKYAYVQDFNTRETWRAKIQAIRGRGWPIHHRGQDAQYALPLRHWKQVRP